MSVTAAQVKELREQTGAGMMDARNALQEAGGDMDKARELLRQKGIATAEKKAGRVTAEGQVAAALADDNAAGVLYEVNCETDFVAKGDAFQEFVQEVGGAILDKHPSDVDALLASPLDGQTMKDRVAERIGQIKENIGIRRFALYEKQGPGLISNYIHTGGRLGVLVELSAANEATAQKPEFAQLARDIAMQIASFAPDFVTRDEIPASVIEEERRIESEKEDLANKPAEIRDKIVTGRVDKLLAQRVLVEQEFVKDPSQKVGELLTSQGKAMGDEGVNIRRFTRYQLGEGIEKKETNFAEEVAAAGRV